MFQSVPREPNLTGRVTSQLEALILENRLQPGDRLPALPELAQRFGVSRTVVREAVGALAAKGLLEVRHGSRAVVRHPSANAVAQSMSLYLRGGQPQLDIVKVSQVRRVLEIEIAGYAAEQRTDMDLQRLASFLTEMAVLVQVDAIPQANQARYMRCDVNFHTALAEATHNELFALLLNSLVDIMLEVRELSFAVPGAPQRALAFHRTIYEQVQAGNVAGARQAMHAHLVDSEEVMRQGLVLRADGNSHNL